MFIIKENKTVSVYLYKKNWPEHKWLYLPSQNKYVESAFKCLVFPFPHYYSFIYFIFFVCYYLLNRMRVHE